MSLPGQNILLGGSQARASAAGRLDGDSELAPLQQAKGSYWSGWRLLGPGLFVCLADTDAGCLMVAAESGSRWGYSLLPLQVLLIPVVYLAQELTIRLGVYTQQGHTACIKQHYGPFWAWSACLLLVLECVLAMISEMSGVAAVGEFWGLNRAVATLVSSILILAVVCFCSYGQIEAIGVSLGLFELVFVVTMFCYHPDPMDVFRGALVFPADKEFISLIAANMGAVIMPWMIYFQQSAVVARRIRTKEDIGQERAHTLIGSIITQLVMIGTLVTLAASRAVNNADKTQSLQHVDGIISALAPQLGYQAARVLVSLGFVGGSLCAAFVVSLAATWAICEAAGYDEQCSLDVPPSKAPRFYGCFVGVVATGAAVLTTGVNIVRLNVVVEMIDGLLLPFAVGFLYLLATGPALPPEARVTGFHKYLVAVLFSSCTCVSFSTAIYGMVAKE